MANQFASLTTALGILKNWYSGPIVSQFNDEIPMYREMEKGKEKFSGLQVVRPVKVRRNQGIGATSDGGLLPSIGQQNVQQATISAKYNYLRFGITGPLLKASQGDKGSFVSGMEYEMSEGLNDLKSDVNRQFFWSGNSTLATVSANATSSNVITVTGRESTEDGSRFLDVGTVVDIYTSAGVLVAQSVAITALSGTTTATLTLSAAVTTSATDLLVRANSFNQEMQGLLYTLDGGTTSIYGIDRSVYIPFQGNVITATGQLTLDLMQQTYNEGKRRGNAKYSVIYCDYDSERMYNKLLVVDRRYIGKVAGDGTFSSKDGSYLEFGGNKVVPDKDSPRRFFFIDISTWKKYVLSELEWADETGQPMIAQSSSDAYEARLRLFANIFCERPSGNAVLKSYTSP